MTKIKTGSFRNIYAGLLACSFAASTAIAATEYPVPSATNSIKTVNISEQQWMISYMVSRQIPSFLMMDKKQGMLHAVRDGKIEFSIPAVSGKDKRDSTDFPEATPADVWPLVLVNEQSSSQAMMVFHYHLNMATGKLNTDSIHRAHHVRDPFLTATASPESRRRSDGCIALKNDETGYDRVVKFVESLKSTPYLAVLPETEHPWDYWGLPKTLAPNNN